MDPEAHHELGKAIKSLKNEGVLILGSGGAVHPLGYAPLRPGAKTDQWAYDFDSWLTKSVTQGDYSALINYNKCSTVSWKGPPLPRPLYAITHSSGCSR